MSAPADPPAPALSPPVPFTTTLQFTHSGPRVRHDRLIHDLKPGGAVLAVNSNVLNIGDPMYCKTKAATVRPTPPGRIARELRGNGNCLQSSLEPVVCLDPSDPIYRRIKQEVDSPHYDFLIKHAPKTGHIQIPGIQLGDWADGLRVRDLFLEYLISEYRRLDLIDPTDTLTLTPPKVVIINCKFHIRNMPPDSVFNLNVFLEILRDLPPAHLPFPLIATECSANTKLNITFRYKPLDPNNPKVLNRVVIRAFTSGRFNVLALKDIEMAHKLHDFLSALIRTHHRRLIFVRPEPDPDSEDEDPLPADE